MILQASFLARIENRPLTNNCQTWGDRDVCELVWQKIYIPMQKRFCCQFLCLWFVLDAFAKQSQQNVEPVMLEHNGGQLWAAFMQSSTPEIGERFLALSIPQKNVGWRKMSRKVFALVQHDNTAMKSKVGWCLMLRWKNNKRVWISKRRWDCFAMLGYWCHIRVLCIYVRQRRPCSLGHRGVSLQQPTAAFGDLSFRFFCNGVKHKTSLSNFKISPWTQHWQSGQRQTMQTCNTQARRKRSRLQAALQLTTNW